MRQLGAVCIIALGIGTHGQVQAQDGAPGQTEEYTGRLIEALTDDESSKVRLQAAVILGRSGDARAIDPLIAALTTDTHYVVRAASATALANLGEPRAISHIIRQAATDSDAFVTEEANRALRKYDREEALPYAVATFGSEDARVRQLVLAYLMEGNPEDAEVVLARALGDNATIATAAREAIAKLPEEHALRFLKQATEHRDASVRRGAVEVLHGRGTKEAANLVLAVYERDIEVDQVRDATRKALRELRSFLPTERFTQEALTHADKHVRARALKLLGVIGGAEASNALLQVLKDDEIYLRGTAVMALRELGDPAAIPTLQALLENPSNQRIALQIKTAVKHLRARSKTPE